MNSKTFFTKLKETCSKIDSDVNNVKNYMISGHENSEEKYATRLSELQTKIKTLKTESSDLKSMLQPKLAHNRDFIKNFKELIAETEESVAKKEEYLKQYGYEPMTTVIEPVETESEKQTPIKTKPEEKAHTPYLIDYGIASDIQNPTTTDMNDRRSSIDDLVIPPDVVLRNPLKSTDKSGSTPTLDSITSIDAKTKETPPLPELPYVSSTMPGTPTLGL